MVATLIKRIAQRLRTRKWRLIAVHDEPIGTWGVYDTQTKHSEIKGVMYSRTATAETPTGRVITAKGWIAGPELNPEPKQIALQPKHLTQ